MNQAGRDALRAAGLSGVRQIVGALFDGQGGYCAGGVIFHLAGLDTSSWLSRAVKGCHLCGATHQTFHAGGTISDEWNLLIHLNNDHHLDFLGIAEKMPVSDAPGGHDAAL